MMTEQLRPKACLRCRMIIGKQKGKRECCEDNQVEIADKITVQLMATDPYLLPRKAIVKTSEKRGFYLAMDIADIWLGRALAGKM